MPYCPICGRECKGTSVVAIPGGDYPQFPQHRCPERTLRGIDSAAKQDDRRDRDPTFYERLREGFALLGQS